MFHSRLALFAVVNSVFFSSSVSIPFSLDAEQIIGVCIKSGRSEWLNHHTSHSIFFCSYFFFCKRLKWYCIKRADFVFHFVFNGMRSLLFCKRLLSHRNQHGRERERADPDSFSLKISWVSKCILCHRKRTQKIEKSNSIDKRMPDFRLMLQWKCHFYCYVLYISPLTPNHTKAHVECDAHSTLGQSPLFQPFNIIYISIWFSNRFPFVQQTKRKTSEREKRIGGNN